MKKLGILLVLALSISSAFADEPMTTPTASSKPLPKIAEVHNSDTVISETVQKALTKNPTLKNQAVSAASTENVVTLEGSVDTKAQADAAISTAKAVKGVKDVKSQLTVKRLAN